LFDFRRIKIRGIARRKPKGCPAWRKMMLEFGKDSEGWLKKYHLRSNVESTISSIKRKFSRFVRSKIEQDQENEILFKVVCYNITVLIMAMMEFKIDI
jgi:transposase